MASFQAATLYFTLILLLLSAATGDDCTPRLNSLTATEQPACSDGRKSILVNLSVTNGCVFRSQKITMCYTENSFVCRVLECVRGKIQACTDGDGFEACAQTVFSECRRGFTFVSAASSISSSRVCCQY